MRARYLMPLALLALSAGLSAATPAATPASPTPGSMPANQEKILQQLIARGVISATAPRDRQEAAVLAYLQLKAKGERDQANPLARKRLNANEEAMKAGAASPIRGRKLGNAANVAPSSPQFKALQGTDKLLLILVEFSETPYTWDPAEGPERTAAGPLHNKIPVPNNSFDLYVPDFSTDHYEDMLFTPGGWTFPVGSPRYAGEHRGSMHDYYYEQSYGQYAVDGKAYGWFQVGKPEAYYGDDRPSGGNDNNLPGTTRDLIKDVVDVINAQNAIPWADYDTDNNCFIDHPLFVHAGIDQSGGGGAQGDDAIWAHSSAVFQQVAGPTGTCPGLYIYNYTIMPEDGGVGVFAHEFGHDLGLPDEYDTAYSGRGDSVAFWSLMSSGSWIGRPAQTQPSAISIWGRMALGWVVNGDNMVRTNLAGLATMRQVRLEQSERWGGPGTVNAIRVDLPPKVVYINTPHSGSREWFGGKADLIDTTLVRAVDLTSKTSAALSFWTWYDIEANWDFGFVQVSTDGGTTWTSLPIAGTTADIVPEGHPDIAANLPGFTGNSGGWLPKTYDLSAYAGQLIQLQFRYMTDWGTTGAGFFVDDISVVADGATLFFDDVEATDPAWTSDGWTRDTGSSSISHYYLMEWRNLAVMETATGTFSLVNFDNGLTGAFQSDPYGSTENPSEPWWFSYNPGLLLWYRDLSYTDNWTGFHPGGGFLLVVDAHAQAMLRPPYLNYGALPWNSRVQTYDSTFSLARTLGAELGYWGMPRDYPSLNAEPNFDDSHKYWDPKASANSVIVPTYGLLFRVLGQAADGSAALIGLGTK